jgi:hypothetical protein
VTKIRNAALEPVVKALDDLAANRLPLPLTVRLHNTRKAVVAALREREEIKKALVQPYLPEGSDSVTAEDPGFAELVGKVEELWREEVGVDTGAPIDLSKLNGVAEKIEVTGASLAVLEEVGLVTLGAEG